MIVHVECEYKHFDYLIVNIGLARLKILDTK
jgi:hypothetical protein